MIQLKVGEFVYKVRIVNKVGFGSLSKVVMCFRSSCILSQKWTVNADWTMSRHKIQTNVLQSQYSLCTSSQYAAHLWRVISKSFQQ